MGKSSESLLGHPAKRLYSFIKKIHFFSSKTFLITRNNTLFKMTANLYFCPMIYQTS